MSSTTISVAGFDPVLDSASSPCENSVVKLSHCTPASQCKVARVPSSLWLYKACKAIGKFPSFQESTCPLQGESRVPPSNRKGYAASLDGTEALLATTVRGLAKDQASSFVPTCSKYPLTTT